MILFARDNWLDPETVGRRTRMAVGANGLRVYVVETRGTTLESRALGSVLSVHPDRAQIAIPISGELLYRRDGADFWVRPGQLALDPAVCFDERWCGDAFQLLMVEFPAPADGAAERGALDANVRAASRRLVDDGFTDLAATHALIAALCSALRSAGLDVPAPSALDERDLRLGEVGRTVARALSSLERRPQWIDLAADLRTSERHARRLVGTFFDYMGLSRYGFRSYLRYHRLMTASLFLSSGNARVDRVASALGYGSDRALATACRQAGLPSPARMGRLAHSP